MASLSFKDWHSYHKVGTGLGVTGLALSGVNYVEAKRQHAAELHRIEVEQKSLAALQRIHKALSIKDVKTS